MLTSVWFRSSINIGSIIAWATRIPIPMMTMTAIKAYNCLSLITYEFCKFLSVNIKIYVVTNKFRYLALLLPVLLEKMTCKRHVLANKALNPNIKPNIKSHCRIYTRTIKKRLNIRKNRTVTRRSSN